MTGTRYAAVLTALLGAQAAAIAIPAASASAAVAYADRAVIGVTGDIDLQARAGAHRAFEHYYQPLSPATRAAARRGIPIILSLNDRHGRDRFEHTWREIAAGRIDREIVARAREVKALRVPADRLYLSTDHEPRVGGYRPDGEGSRAYWAARKHVIALFDYVGVRARWAHIEMSFCFQTATRRQAYTYLPPRDGRGGRVDVFGVDMYQGRSAADQQLRVDLFLQRHHRGGITQVWPEFGGRADATDQTAWTRRAVATADRHQVRVAVYYAGQRGGWHYPSPTTRGYLGRVAVGTGRTR